jgi:hypothetical protein
VEDKMFGDGMQHRSLSFRRGRRRVRLERRALEITWKKLYKDLAYKSATPLKLIKEILLGSKNILWQKILHPSPLLMQ